MNKITFEAFGDELTKIAEYTIAAPPNMDPDVGARHGTISGALGRYNAQLEGEKYKGNIEAKERLIKQLQAEKKLAKLQQQAGE